MESGEYNFSSDDLGNVYIAKTENGMHKNICKIPVSVVNSLYKFLRHLDARDEVDEYIGYYIEEARDGEAFMPRGVTPAEIWEADDEIADKYIEYVDGLDSAQCLYDAFEYVVDGLGSSI